MTTAIKTRTEVVAADKLSPNPYQPRAVLDPQVVREIADSIKNPQVGLLQKPLARPAKKRGQFEIAFGHLRVEAIRLLIAEGTWTEGIPVEVRDMTDADMAIIALTENVQRKDITPVEMFRAWKRALDIEGMTVGSLADSLGLDHSTVSNNLRLLELPLVVQEKLDTGELSPRAAREFLPLQNTDHSHEDIMAMVIRDIDRTSMGSAPDWRGPNIRNHIRGIITGRFQSDWRPLEGAKDDKDQYGNAGSAGREPSFDVAAFKLQSPMAVHQVPVWIGEKSRTWTCDAKEWRRWQSAATRAQNRDAEENGQPAGGPKPSVRDQVLAHDPVAQSIVGVSTETVAQKVADKLESPTLGEARQIADEIHEYTDDQDSDKTETVAKAFQRLVETVGIALRAKPAEADKLLEEVYIRDLLSRLKLEEAGLEFGEVSQVISNLVENYKEDVAEAAAKTQGRKKLTAAQEEALGTRAQVHKSFASIKGFKQAINSGSHAHSNPPSYMQDREECIKRCTTGAVWAQTEYQDPIIVCTNEEHFKEKVAAGLKALEEKISRRRGQINQEDKAAVAVLVEQPMDAFRLVAAVLMSQLSFRPYETEGLNYRDVHEFVYWPDTIRETVEFLGVKLAEQQYQPIPRDEAIKALGNADDSVVKGIAARLLVYGLRAHEPGAVKALTNGQSKEAGPKKERILELHQKGLSTRKIATEVDVRHSYVDKVIRQERERAATQA